MVRCRQSGLSYVEVMVTLVLIGIALVPAMDALRTGSLGAAIHAEDSQAYFRQMALMEQVLAEPFSSLLTAAELAADEKTPTTYSDSPGTLGRRLVFIGRYDGDADPFVVSDPNADGDNNPFTGYVGLLWVRVMMDGQPRSFSSLIKP